MIVRSRPPLPAGMVNVADLVGTPAISPAQARANRAARPPGSRTVSGLNPRGAVPGLVPLDATALWAAVERGQFPPPIRGPWGLAWRLDDVIAWRSSNR